MLNVGVMGVEKEIAATKAEAKLKELNVVQ